MPFAEPPDCRIARHFADRRELVRDERRRGPHPRGGRCRLAAGMAATDDDDVVVGLCDVTEATGSPFQSCWGVEPSIDNIPQYSINVAKNVAFYRVMAARSKDFGQIRASLIVMNRMVLGAPSLELVPFRRRGRFQMNSLFRQTEINPRIES